jgi:hypothetical protein
MTSQVKDGRRGLSIWGLANRLPCASRGWARRADWRGRSGNRRGCDRGTGEDVGSLPNGTDVITLAAVCETHRGVLDGAPASGGFGACPPAWTAPQPEEDPDGPRRCLPLRRPRRRRQPQSLRPNARAWLGSIDIAIKTAPPVFSTRRARSWVSSASRGPAVPDRDLQRRADHHPRRATLDGGRRHSNRRDRRQRLDGGERPGGGRGRGGGRRLASVSDRTRPVS